MNRISVLFLLTALLLTACSGNNHPEYFGNYYVCYRDGNVLAEDDSVHQVYICLAPDHTYKVKDSKGIELGKWKTKDGDDFDITYFYTSYKDYLFDNSAGETIINYLPEVPEAKVFAGSHWYGVGKMAAYSSTQLLFCKQGKRLTDEQLKTLLSWTYSSSPK